MNTPGHELTNNHIWRGQETNQIWTQETGTHDTHNRTLTIGVFDFMQRHENRSAADLKQCMPVRKFVRLELAPTPRHCHMCHQSNRDSVSRTAGSLQSDCGSADDDTAVSRLAKFTTWQQWRVFLTSSIPIQLTNLILLGKYHIHVKKWTKAKPNFAHFIKEIKQYGSYYIR